MAELATRRAPPTAWSRIRTLLWSLVLATGGALLLAVIVLRLLGYVPVVIAGPSMEPAIPYGALAFTKSTPVEDVEPGDVITFDPPGDVPRVTHRVEEVVHRNEVPWFVTKGDANEEVDNPGAWVAGTGTESERTVPGVRYDRGEAPVYAFHVPWLGKPIAWLRQHTWLWMVLLVLPLVLILVELVTWIWRDDLRRATAWRGRRVRPGSRPTAREPRVRDRHRRKVGG